MDRPWCNDQLGVNMIGKRYIKKSPLHQPNFSNGIAPSSAQQQPQVYKISKNGSRSIVHQLIGSPSRESFYQPPPPPPLAQNLPKPQNTWLQKIRPTVQTQINQPHVPPSVMAQPTHDLVAESPMQGYVHPLPQGSQSMMGDGDQFRSNTAESPVSVYMRYLESSLRDSEPNGNQMQPSHEHQPQPPSPPPQLHNHNSPWFNGCASSMPILPTPRFNDPPQQIYSNILPSPRFNGRGILPSPTSQYLLQSPSAYQNLLSPRSPYPLLSPRVRYPPSLTPRGFPFSSMAQPGILGPAPIPQPPASPGPRWRRSY